MPTTRIAMAATTLAMLTSSVQVNTPMPAIVNGMPMLRMLPASAASNPRMSCSTP